MEMCLAGGSHELRNTVCAFQTFLVSPMGMGKESEEKPEKKIFYRTGNKMGNWTWKSRNDDENLQLAYLLPWTE